MVTIIWLGLCYILGSLPFGILIAQSFCKIDPRQQGSKNIGATNVARLCGFKYGFAVLLLDIFKGYMPIMIAYKFSSSAIFISLTALAVIIGHMYSVFLYGKGGKGVATTVGVFLALAPGAAVWAIGICLAVIYLTGFVSLGSLALVSSAPVLFLITGNFAYILVSLIILGLVFWRHEENIHRLLSGEESNWRRTQTEE
ncbi:glycerol-3-phosphate 1-O-acyltransferase PlsY [Desulfonatronovibrio hydrogenovorans]|uniref:glycerol-3-phosphate 1-O-acyltransferase PlsY n=1 Tax=Desulfonatronovibrio hydrogenovorans TaxID=53245 RepID=UPI00048F1C53|nr:glycerol-3-phosphate 1-O-acyltransferase PlsY [Desulfonatronovibrio hydrogenovorans]